MKIFKQKHLSLLIFKNDITKHNLDIIGNINAAIEWAVVERLRLEKKRKRMQKHAHCLYQA